MSVTQENLSIALDVLSTIRQQQLALAEIDKLFERPASVTIEPRAYHQARLEAVAPTFASLADELLRVYATGDLGNFVPAPLWQQDQSDTAQVSRKLTLTHPDFPQHFFDLGSIGKVTRLQNNQIHIAPPDPSQTIHDFAPQLGERMKTAYVLPSGETAVVPNGAPLGGYWYEGAKRKYGDTTTAFVGLAQFDHVTTCQPVAFGTYGQDNLGLIVTANLRNAISLWQLSYQHSLPDNLDELDHQDIVEALYSLGQTPFGQAVNLLGQAQRLVHDHLNKTHNQLQSKNVHVTPELNQIILGDWGTSRDLSQYSQDFSSDKWSPYGLARIHDLRHTLGLLTIGGMYGTEQSLAAQIACIVGYRYQTAVNQDNFTHIYFNFDFGFLDTLSMSEMMSMIMFSDQLFLPTYSIAFAHRQSQVLDAVVSHTMSSIGVE